jgi:RNA polymerase sigma-70 factor (ECF subfamily)
MNKYALNSTQHRTRTTSDSRKKLSDEKLYSRYEAGDEKAFDELFRRYRKPIFHFILRFLRDTNASQDAVQDLFLRVIRDPSRFQARSRFSTWLHTVARNLCIDLLRKRKHRNALSLDQPGPPRGSPYPRPRLIEELRSKDPSPEQSVANGSLRVKLLVAIHSIPDEQRVVFLLREISGFSFAEIAQVVGIPHNTAKSRMRYAIFNLRKALFKLGVVGCEEFLPNPSPNS